MKTRIQVGKLVIEDRQRAAINKVLDAGFISEGEAVRKFEDKWARYVGVKYCVATSSGTAALITALTSLKYRYRLETCPFVVTSPLTYISDANAIVLSGFQPIFIDIDPDTFCIDAEKIDEYFKRSKNLKKHSIILPIDLMGCSVDLDKIKAIAKKYNLYVLEDAAQAHGTLYKGEKCGSNATVGIFSFYIAHNIQAGELGAITTNNLDIYRMAKRVKTNGRYCCCKVCTRSKGFCPAMKSKEINPKFDPRFYHEVIGYNFKAMEFQAVLAIEQLKNIEKTIARRRYNVKYLNKRLSKFSDVIKLPYFDDKISYFAYPLIIKTPGLINREKLRNKLAERGIETRPFFSCIPTQQPAYSYLAPLYKNKLPNAEMVADNGFYIGCHQYLSEGDLNYIVHNFSQAIEKCINEQKI